MGNRICHDDTLHLSNNLQTNTIHHPQRTHSPLLYSITSNYPHQRTTSPLLYSITSNQATITSHQPKTTSHQPTITSHQPMGCSAVHSKQQRSVSPLNRSVTTRLNRKQQEDVQQDFQESLGFEEENNPLKMMLKKNLLKTNISASNNLMAQNKTILSPPKYQIAINHPNQQSTGSDQNIPQTPQQITSLPKATLSSNEVFSPLATFNRIFTFQTTLNFIEQQPFSLRPTNKKRSSLQMRISLPQQNLEQTQQVKWNRSDYIFSQKNVFQPIRISKESFVRFKNQDINKFYVFGHKLGEGTYGNVYKAEHRESGAVRAVKILKKSRITNEKHSKIMNQIQILKKLDHPNIIKIYEAYIHNDNYYIVTEYCSGGSLSKLLERYSKLSPHTIKAIFRSLFSVLTYLHKQNIVHRDIKLDNVVVVNNLQLIDDCQAIDIRLIDFGLATQLKNKRVKDRQKIGTWSYMAPEIIQGVYSTACDVWSSAIMLYCLLGGYNPFRGKNKEQTLQNILHKDLAFKGQAWQLQSIQSKQLLIKLLNKNMNLRWTAWQALNHPWLKITHPQGVQKRVFQRVSQKMCDYYHSNNFVSMIQSLIAFKTLSQQQLKQCANMFAVLDKNCDGCIQSQQFKLAFTNSGLFHSSQMQTLLKAMDNNFQAKIDYCKFVAILSDRSKLFAKSKLIQAFKYLDTKESGYLQKSTLIKLCKLSDHKEVEAILKDLDQNNDQQISMEEFVRYFEEFRFS